MTYNPNIILSGNAFDPIGAMSRGAEAANQQNAFARQTAYDQSVTDNGAAAMRGDVTAQNALAGFDPGMVQGMQANALGMDATRLGMDATRQDMDMQTEELAMRREEARAQTAAELAKQVSTLDAAALAKDAAKTRDMMIRAGKFQAAGDEAGYNLYLQQSGVDPREYPMSDYRYIAATVEGVLDAVDAAGPKAISPNDRFKIAGSTLFDLGAEGGPRPVGEGSTPEETIFGPDGQPIVTRGGPGSNVKFTEGQSKDIGFSTRARAAIDTLEPIAGSLTSRADTVLNSDYIPLGLGRELQSDNFQVANNAGDNLLLAILRKDTGAAITAEERAEYGRVFLPAPGDSPALLAQKASARALAVAGLEAGMNAQQILAQGNAILKAVGPAVKAQAPAPATAAGGQGSQPSGLSPEAQRLLDKYPAP